MLQLFKSFKRRRKNHKIENAQQEKATVKFKLNLADR